MLYVIAILLMVIICIMEPEFFGFCIGVAIMVGLGYAAFIAMMVIL